MLSFFLFQGSSGLARWIKFGLIPNVKICAQKRNTKKLVAQKILKTARTLVLVLMGAPLLITMCRVTIAVFESVPRANDETRATKTLRKHTGLKGITLKVSLKV